MIGDYFIPKGTNVCVNLCSLHKEKEIYGNKKIIILKILGDPYEFRPERWSTEDQEKNKNISFYSWAPFSLGSRSKKKNKINNIYKNN
jgi:cytochrome P450